ncbi:trypsin-like serine protease [Streptomyces bathyalis]|uniref:Trypsin-like serine protease n=1 Tax=Streptomyces bathyalis TaxID=2710756 RepID=A0A7T1T7P8_9ACTN|nr:trypsin-like serine protease [Streptomyces bathyalis]QPP07894.1 trypsin-like serine protease [Streptomyces bathyalis]
MTSTRAALAALLTCSTSLALMGAAPAPYPPSSKGERWPQGTVRTVGKLVAKLPGHQAESCSGAIIDSPSGSVVATAAHCISSPERPVKPVAMYFQPAYRGKDADKSGRRGGTGDAPKAVIAHGWKVESWKTAPGWDTHKDLESVLPNDWAFLRMEKRNGRTIQQVYGANKLKTEPVPGGTTATLGYPASSPYDGETLNYCAGKAHRYRGGEIPAANVGALSLTPCRLTQGVSGGPWLRGFDKKRGAGTLVAVTSVGSENELLGRPYPKSARGLLKEFGAKHER